MMNNADANKSAQSNLRAGRVATLRSREWTRPRLVLAVHFPLRTSQITPHDSPHSPCTLYYATQFHAKICPLPWSDLESGPHLIMVAWTHPTHRQVLALVCCMRCTLFACPAAAHRRHRRCC